MIRGILVLLSTLATLAMLVLASLGAGVLYEQTKAPRDPQVRCEQAGGVWLLQEHKCAVRLMV